METETVTVTGNPNCNIATKNAVLPSPRWNIRLKQKHLAKSWRLYFSDCHVKNGNWSENEVQE